MGYPTPGPAISPCFPITPLSQIPVPDLSIPPSPYPKRSYWIQGFISCNRNSQSQREPTEVWIAAVVEGLLSEARSI